MASFENESYLWLLPTEWPVVATGDVCKSSLTFSWYRSQTESFLCVLFWYTVIWSGWHCHNLQNVTNRGFNKIMVLVIQLQWIFFAKLFTYSLVHPFVERSKSVGLLSHTNILHLWISMHSIFAYSRPRLAFIICCRFPFSRHLSVDMVMW